MRRKIEMSLRTPLGEARGVLSIVRGGAVLIFRGEIPHKGLRLRIDAGANGDGVVVSGDTYPHRETLRGLGFRWDPDNRFWFYDGRHDGFSLPQEGDDESGGRTGSI